jgi:DNA polymerase
MTETKLDSRDLALKYFTQQEQLGVKRFYFDEPVKGPEQETLESLRAQYGDCRACGLSGSRKNLVFGEGSPDARLMFIGEAPGYDEDRLGRPFVGKAGRLLDKIIKAMGLRREDVYIANILKCRPPENRNPDPEETQTCRPILQSQIRIIRPDFICALGRVAAHNLLDITDSMARMRGRFYDFMGIKLIVTYHPAALLRHESWKRDTWNDIKILMKEMRLAVPEKYR